MGRDNSEPGNRKERFLLVAALAVSLGLLGYSLLGPESGKRTQLENELSQTLEENRKLRELNQHLTLSIEALQKKGEYLEKIVREELGLVKPGEVILKLPEAGDGASSKARP